MYHRQILYTMNLFHLEDHLCILKTCRTPEINFSNQMFDHLKQLFALGFQDSFGVAKVIHFQHYKLLT